MVIKKNSSFSVAASPLNSIKLDLGIFLCLGIIMLIVLEIISVSLLIEILFLGLYGMLVLLWVYIKTRLILKATFKKNGQE